MRLQVKGDIAGKQQPDQRDHLEIAPVASRRDLAPGRGGHQQQKARVNKHCNPPAGRGGEGHGEPAGNPHHDECHQRRALQRQPAGPVRNCREQESGDDGRQIAVEHLMHMPVARREGREELQFAVKRRQPDQDRKPGLDRAEQEERPEAGGKQRPALVRAVPGNATCCSLTSHRRRSTHFVAACCESRSNSVAKTCLALPLCGIALA